METMPDHLHIFLSAPPTAAPTDIIRKLKSITANKIFSAFPSLKKKYFWIERRIEHILYSIFAQAVRWCLERSVKVVCIGDPEGVREKDCGRHHNQRMGQWVFGRLRNLLEYKLKRYGIELIQVDEHGTSGTCPVYGEYTKQTGRVFRCGNASCGFSGIHRDVVGASGILDKAVNGNFTKGRRLPGKVEYLRPQVLAPQKAA